MLIFQISFSIISVQYPLPNSSCNISLLGYTISKKRNLQTSRFNRPHDKLIALISLSTVRYHILFVYLFFFFPVDSMYLYVLSHWL
jgi:hypothetical protein